jgi:hypothetical protein
MVHGSDEAARGGEVLGHGRHRKHRLVGARGVGKLDRNGFSSALWDGAVQLLDSAFRLKALVKANEAHAFRDAYSRKQCVVYMEHMVA